MPYSKRQLISLTHGSADGNYSFGSNCDFPVDEIVFRCFYAISRTNNNPILAYSTLIGNKTIPCFCIGKSQFFDGALNQSDNGTNEWRHTFSNPLGVSGTFQIDIRLLTGGIPTDLSLPEEDILVEIEYISKSKYLYK